MLQAVNKAGDPAVALNANEHVPKCATMSLASARPDDLCMVQEAWQTGGRDDVGKAAKEKEAAAGTGDRKWLRWIAGAKDITPALQIHKRIRRLVKEEAAKLG